MIDLKILSEKYQNLDMIAKEKKNEYLNANPFPCIVLDNFFADNFLEEVVKNFPNLEKINSSQEIIKRFNPNI